MRGFFLERPQWCFSTCCEGGGVNDSDERPREEKAR